MHIWSTLFKNEFTGFKMHFYTLIIDLVKFRLAQAGKNIRLVLADITSFYILSLLVHIQKCKLIVNIRRSKKSVYLQTTENILLFVYKDNDIYQYIN
jgi:hypothetical protein